MISGRRVIAGLSVVGACAAIGFVTWKITGTGRLPDPLGEKPAHKVAAVKPLGKGLDQVLKVLGHGGTSLELEEAIGFLDTVAWTGTSPLKLQLLDCHLRAWG